MDNTVTILGARGSMNVGGADFLRYGGATTCVLVRMSGHAVLLDAGTGLMNPPPDLLDIPALPLILTHAHADHLLGLPLSPLVMRRGVQLDIYAATRLGLDAETQVRRFLSPPLWPVGPDQFPADIRFHDLPPELYLYADGNDSDEIRAAIEGVHPAEASRDAASVIRVASMNGVHPSGVSLLRLDCGGKSVVLVTDCTLTDAIRPAVLDFARDCSLLLCDGQYSDAEWPTRAAFGHNTWRAAAQFARDCRAKQVRIVHHDPFHSDATLDAASAEIGVPFAREGEVILL